MMRTCPFAFGSWRRRREAARASIHGGNWIRTSGRNTSMNRTPDKTTMLVSASPAGFTKMMSPSPSVVIVDTVQ